MAIKWVLLLVSLLCVADGDLTASRQACLSQRCSLSARTRTPIFQVDAFVPGFHEMSTTRWHGSVRLGLVLTTRLSLRDILKLQSYTTNRKHAACIITTSGRLNLVLWTCCRETVVCNKSSANPQHFDNSSKRCRQHIEPAELSNAERV